MDDPNREEALVFHYSRERRLARASETVRRMNETGPRKRPTLFGTLTANRALAFLFLAVVMLSATALVTAYLVPSDDRKDFAGNELELSAFRYEGATYLALRKKAGRGAYVGVLRLGIREAGREAFALSREIVFGAAQEEEFKFKLDGEMKKIEAVVAGDASFVALTAAAR